MVEYSDTQANEFIGQFLDLNDGGECRDSNPEYYRGGFELLRDQLYEYIGGDFDCAGDELAGLIVAHSSWKLDRDPNLAIPR